VGATRKEGEKEINTSIRLTGASVWLPTSVVQGVLIAFVPEICVDRHITEFKQDGHGKLYD
jgi:hypothetical protein